MFDPRSRLYRHVPGERAHLPRPLVERVVERDRAVEPRTTLPERKQVRDVSVRPTRRSVDPGPYVPKLIRLIRRRYALSTGRPRTTHDISFVVPPRTRERFGSVLREVRADLPKAQKIRATDVHVRPEPRSRPSADAWLGTRKGGPDG